MKFPVDLLLTWFDTNRRDLPWRRTRSVWKIWVAEVMLQQTRTDTVKKYYGRFLGRFPTVRRLAEADLEEVLKLWEGMGYYARARNLWRAASVVMAEHGGRIPKDPAVFDKLPGVGDYIAAAVMSIACGHPLPVVDGNVLRVYGRYAALDDDIGDPATRGKVRARLGRIIPSDRPGDFNQAMMETGALVCLPRNPRCPECPLRTGCRAFRAGRVSSFPVKGRRPASPSYEVAVAVIVRGKRFYVQKRPDAGHLGGLWEFPGGKLSPGETPEQGVVRECREEIGVDLEILGRLARVHHAYTHFRIDLHVFVCRLKTGRIRTKQPHLWIGVDGIDRYPFPAANHRVFPRLRDYMRSSRSGEKEKRR
jgi:A/G-specific adenine glycosylase